MSESTASQPTFQTVQLARGSHSSPAKGVCVMELASMLAGEPFSDRPQSVSPVIAAFLRAYNDSIDDRRRQDLYACASEVVGSRATAEVENGRAARLIAWGLEQRMSRRWRRVLPERAQARAPEMAATEAGPFAVHSIGRRRDAIHAAVLELVTELVAIGDAGAPQGAAHRAVAPTTCPAADVRPDTARAT